MRPPTGRTRGLFIAADEHLEFVAAIGTAIFINWHELLLFFLRGLSPPPPDGCILHGVAVRHETDQTVHGRKPPKNVVFNRSQYTRLKFRRKAGAMPPTTITRSNPAR